MKKTFDAKREMFNKIIISGYNMNSKPSSNLKIIYFILGLILLIQPKYSAQQESPVKIPGTLSFSAVVTDSYGKTLADGKYNFTFAIYPDSAGGNAVWSEIHKDVFVKNGEIDVQLGNGSIPNPLNIKFDRKYYLGIKLDESPEFSQRIELLPTPYSITTNLAQIVRDSSITTQKLAPLSVTDDKIKSISWDKIINLPPVKLSSSLKVPSAKSINDLPVYWRRYGNYLATGNEFLGTVNDRNLVIKTDSIQRMLFDPYGYVQMGTVQDSVFFEVIGTTTLGDVYVKNRALIGTDFSYTNPPYINARLEINSLSPEYPFKVDNNGSNVFSISDKGRVAITSTLNGGDSEIENYPLTIEGPDQGMAIKINGSTSNSNKKYMMFWDDTGVVGRIEGMDAADYFSDAKNIAHDVWIVAQGVALGVAYGLSALEVPDIVQGTAQLIYEAFVTTWNLTHLGVQYQSSSADYAEWLKKLDPNEKFSPGDIVGVYGGKISKNTKDADCVMCVSLSPAVLGNMPKKEDEQNFVKVAFKGQVPIKVFGTVHKGDYIIPSGLNDGIGIAVTPQLMTANEFSAVLGRAWESADGEYLNMINTSVGLKLKDLAVYIKGKMNESSKLQSEMIIKDNELNSTLALLNELEEQYKSLQSKLTVMRSILNENTRYSTLKANENELSNKKSGQ